MQTYISLLRGINVSGQKMIKMEALKISFEKLGFQKVQTYIQSGNVVFRFSETPTKSLETIIAKQLVLDFGYEVPVLVLTLDELTKISNHNPFLTKRSEDISKLHVTFLSEVPQQMNLSNVTSYASGQDEFIAVENSIYLFCSDGYGKTKFNNTFFESKLKLTATTRNWKTVTALVEISKLT